MLDAKLVPNWHSRNSSDMYRWWEEMAEMGLAFHPDDPPCSIVYPNNQPCFSPIACLKLEKILSDMLQAHGDAVYHAGQSAIMKQFGWQESPTEDCWLRIA